MNPLDVALHIDRMSRRCSAHRPSTSIVDLAAGWLRYGGIGLDTENPSSGRNRISWLGLNQPPTEAAFQEMLEQIRRLNCGRVFLWASPTTLNSDIESALATAGATQWPWVRYLAFARASQPLNPITTPFTVRKLEPDEVAHAFHRCSHWYSTVGAADATAIVLSGTAEAFAAFHGPNPIALSLLIPDGKFAYMGWAGTDPNSRNQGAQSALIAARITRAHELGIPWCVSETNTVVEVSLKNLLKSGFQPIAEWKVFSWDCQPSPPPASPVAHPRAHPQANPRA